jgi:hypothetical protein
MVEADDDKMNAATETARKTVDTFIKALRSPKPSQKSFSVKTVFKEGDNTERLSNEIGNDADSARFGAYDKRHRPCGRDG